MERWRVAVLTAVPPVALGYTAILRGLGHEVAAVIVPRGGGGALHLELDPDDVDLVFASSKRSLARLFAGYELDLVVCTGFPWLVPEAALSASRLGVVNGHPSLLPRYRGPFPIAWAVRNGEAEIGMSYHLMDARFDTGNLLAQRAVPLADDDTWDSLMGKVSEVAAELLPAALERLAGGDRGEEQQGGDYFGHFEDDYVLVDPAAGAAAVHRQVRAWGFVPPHARRGPVHEGRKLLRTSLTEVEGAERLDCADAPLWILETEAA
ncbi:MAG TPA: formyltransferase family protein [Gaiellaceae bacterium]|nr:formyltransferase family protein [Gaiellaceae bacterium]